MVLLFDFSVDLIYGVTIWFLCLPCICRYYLVFVLPYGVNLYLLNFYFGNGLIVLLYYYFVYYLLYYFYDKVVFLNWFWFLSKQVVILGFTLSGSL